MALALEEIAAAIHRLERRIAKLEAVMAAQMERSPQPAPAPRPPPEQPQPEPEASPLGIPKIDFPDLDFDDSPQAAKPKGPPQKLTVKAAIEEYPHITNKVFLLWGHPECDRFLDSLVIDERGNRRGFNPEVMSEILFLVQLARLRSGPRSPDLWEDRLHIGDRT